jgi:hypothetical protein
MARNSYYRTPHWSALKHACHERDGWRCTVSGCQTPAYRLTCDHIKRRPNVDYPTAYDVLSNVRTLCGNHDAQVKELASGRRRQDGKLIVKGAKADGTPLDPNHPWSRANHISSL